MRKLSILGLGLAFFLVISSGAYGQPFRLLSDREIQHGLTGTWVASWGHGLTTTNVIAADGSYVSQTSGYPKGTPGRYRGTFLAKDGMVVNRTTISNQPVVVHLHIIRLDSHELVWSNDAAVTLPTFHKVGG